MKVLSEAARQLPEEAFQIDVKTQRKQQREAGERNRKTTRTSMKRAVKKRKANEVIRLLVKVPHSISRLDHVSTTGNLGSLGCYFYPVSTTHCFALNRSILSISPDFQSRFMLSAAFCNALSSLQSLTAEDVDVLSNCNRSVSGIYFCSCTLSAF